MPGRDEEPPLPAVKARTRCEPGPCSCGQDKVNQCLVQGLGQASPADAGVGVWPVGASASCLYPGTESLAQGRRSSKACCGLGGLYLLPALLEHLLCHLRFLTTH